MSYQQEKKAARNVIVRIGIFEYTQNRSPSIIENECTQKSRRRVLGDLSILVFYDSRRAILSIPKYPKSAAFSPFDSMSENLVRNIEIFVLVSRLSL
jgi:hypothetical protein